jgi:hypothetical protein
MLESAPIVGRQRPRKEPQCPNHERFIVDDEGSRVGVVLDIKDYERLLDELGALRAYDEAKASGERPIPCSEARKRLNLPNA